MSEKYDKESLKEKICCFIGDLSGEEFTLEGVYGWTYMECKIEKVEGNE